jgi:hypothetical protein
MKKRTRIVSGLAALAALFLAPLAEASLTRVNPAERAIEAPALTLTEAARGPSEFSLFEGHELTDAAAESERAPSFHPLAAVSLLDERAQRELAMPLEQSYPKTRYRVFDFLGAPLIGVERGVTLELHWRSASFSCGLASGTVGWLSEDPLGPVDSPNLYGYVGLRPHEKTDPLGLMTPSERVGRFLGRLWQGVQGVVSALPERIIESQTESYEEEQALKQFGPAARDRVLVGHLQKNVSRMEHELPGLVPGVNSVRQAKRLVSEINAGNEEGAVDALGDLAFSAMGDTAVVRGMLKSGATPEGVTAPRRAPPVNDYDVAGWESYYAENPGFARSVGAAGARGGRGPVDKGKAGVAETIVDETLSGNKVAGTEVTIDTAGGRVRLDVVARTPSGQLRLIDSKKGPRAHLTPNQRTGYPALGVTGGIPRGKKAQAAGLTPGEPLDPNDVIIRKSD